VNIDKYADLGGPTYKDIKNPTKDAKAYTYQQKVYVAVADPSLVSPKGTAVILRSQHRQIGKTECLAALVKGGRAVMVNGVDSKADKKTVPASHPRAPPFACEGLTHPRSSHTGVGDVEAERGWRNRLPDAECLRLELGGVR